MSESSVAAPLSGRRLQTMILTRTGDKQLAHDVHVVSRVLPFKVTPYVLDQLIDWEAAPDDPIFRLVFPHRDMLDPKQFSLVEKALDGEDAQRLEQVVADIRAELNPHPGDQLSKNVPEETDFNAWGLQHKYAHTVLVFPRQGQTCHSYCAYCFRWAQFTGNADERLAVAGPETMLTYLARQPGVTDVLLTGGDPLVMRTELLASYLEPLLAPEYEHVQTIRIGTKALAFWPFRLTHGDDADRLLHLVEHLVAGGKQVAFMLHLSHARELQSEVAQRAVSRLRDAGAILRSQAPIVRHVNDDGRTWSDLWTQQVRLGIHPYYLFVERDTGAQRYFGISLERALNCYQEAIRQVSGLGRTARGPVMSTSPGKVVVDGIVSRDGHRAFVLRFLQARDESLVGHPFFAAFDPAAEWWSQLVPLGAEDARFFAAGGGC